MNTTFTKTISIRDVYGTATPEIPKGYKAIEFRLPRKGEAYLSSSDYWLTACDDHARMNTSIPYLILSKIPDPIIIKGSVEYSTKSTVCDIYSQDVNIPEGYEFVDFRPANQGEYFIPFFNTTAVDYANSEWAAKNATNARIIVRKVTTT